jgi:hypothetical protein
MRRNLSLIISGLVLSFLGHALFSSAAAPRALAQDADKAKSNARSQLDGAWRLVSAKDPNSGEMRKLPDVLEMTKLVVGGRFAWTVVQEGKVVAGAGGRYTVQDDAYTEEVLFSLAANQEPLVGKSFKFSWKIQDGKWHHQGKLKVQNAEQDIDEIWERIP